MMDSREDEIFSRALDSWTNRAVTAEAEVKQLRAQLTQALEANAQISKINLDLATELTRTQTVIHRAGLEQV